MTGPTARQLAAEANARGESAFIVTGADTDADDTFGCEAGHWNVSRIRRDAEAGAFGAPRELATATAVASHPGIEVEPAKVATFFHKPEVLEAPLFAVQVAELGAVLVDGHHRLRARHLRRLPNFLCWIVPASLEPTYRIRFFQQHPGCLPVEITAAEMQDRRLKREGKRA